MLFDRSTSQIDYRYYTASHWRKIVDHYFRHFKGSDYNPPDGKTESYLLAYCQRHLQHGSGSSTSDVYYNSIVLFLFGELDAVNDIIDSFPIIGYFRHIKLLIDCLRFLLPLPEEMAIDINFNLAERESDREQVRQWVHEHKDQLVFSEAGGRYVFRSQER